jgi:uracil phosphoribosyltransferase
MRKKETSNSDFRRLLFELSQLMAYEITRYTPLQLESIQTPLESLSSPIIDAKKMVLVSILRAGNGILDGVLSIVPTARVGHIGLYRDPKTLNAIEQNFRASPDYSEA